MNSLILYTFSIPGLTLHTGPELCKILFISNGIFNKIITSLANEQQLKIIFNSLEGSYALVSFVLYFFKYNLSLTKFLNYFQNWTEFILQCLTGNIIELASYLEDHKSVNFLDLSTVIKNLLDLCGQYVTAKKSNLTHWHPVLGWFSVSMDSYLQNSIETVRNQLAKLWSPTCLKFFCQPLVDTVQKLPVPPPPPVPTIGK